MRTLKKTLSLVLALVLCFGLVGTAFAGNFDKYTDAEDLGAAYAEAADLMIGLGIISGMSATELGAEGTLTREQAAKIVAYMVLGKNLADATTADVAPFKDVAADRWSAGYIAFCADKGILAGYGDGNFGPADELTGYQFAKMLLAALGYGKAGEFTPESWALNTGILAFDLKLFAGDAKAATHDPITRQQAMLMAYNALNKDIQAYSKLTETYGDSGKDLGASYAAAQQKTAALGDGLNYTYWTVNSVAVTGNHLKDVAVATFAAGTTYKAIAAGLGITATSVKSDATTIKNGAAQNDTVELKDYINDVAHTVPAGSVLVVYKNAEAGATYKLAYTETYLAKAAVTKLTGADAGKDSVKFTVYAATPVEITVKVATGTYTNNAYYAVVPNATNTAFLSVAAPATAEGKVTGTGTGYVRVGETKYNLATVCKAVDALDYNTNTFVFYLNAAGEILGYVKKTNAPVVTPFDGVLYLNSAQYSVTDASANLYGAVAYAASAKANVNFVGTAAQVVDLAVYTAKNPTTGAVTGTYVGKDNTGIAITNTNGIATNLTALTAGWYYYNTTAAGYVLTAVADAAAADVSLKANVAAVITGKYADANTVVNVYNYDATTKAAAQTTYTGIAGYPAVAKTYANADALIVVNYVKNALNADTNLVKSIDIYTAVASTPATTPVNYAYFKAAGEQYADGKYFQGFYVNGAYVEYKIEPGKTVTLNTGKLYNITLNEKGELQAAAEVTLKTGKVEYVADTYIVLEGGAPIYLVAGAPVYNVATAHAGEADVLAIGDTIKYAEGTGLNEGKLAVAYITVEAVVA